jgi:hypothetical protein
MRHWWASLCDKRFVGHENAIQNAPCNRPLIRNSKYFPCAPSSDQRFRAQVEAVRAYGEGTASSGADQEEPGGEAEEEVADRIREGEEEEEDQLWCQIAVTPTIRLNCLSQFVFAVKLGFFSEASYKIGGNT